LRFRGRSSSVIGSPQTTAHSRRLRNDQRNVSSPDGDDRNALLHRDHQPARVQRPRMAEALTRPLDVHADELPLTHQFTRVAQRLAVALAAPHAEDAEPAQQRPEPRDVHELGLRQEVERPRREGPDQWMVDPREVVGRDHRAALTRTRSTP
jgi:hypothetical protein